MFSRRGCRGIPTDTAYAQDLANTVKLTITLSYGDLTSSPLGRAVHTQTLFIQLQLNISKSEQKQMLSNDSIIK